MRIAQIVVTDAFAGTERYVADISTRLGHAGHDVTVFGGAATRMPRLLGSSARWLACATPTAALRTLSRSGRFDIVHAHLTNAETAAVLTKPRHRALVVATRHIAGRRGNSRLGSLIAPVVGRGIDHEIAISRFVADRVGLGAEQVLHNGVESGPSLWSVKSHTVVMAHRLELEKDTSTGIDAWHASGLANDGWQLLIAGSGAEAASLEAKVNHEGIDGVSFLGELDVMSELWAKTGILLAPALAEPMGLTVLEGMSAGLPVVASASGGHLETVLQSSPEFGFAPGEFQTAAGLLRRLADADLSRAATGEANQRIQREQFDIDQHVRGLVDVYLAAL